MQSSVKRCRLAIFFCIVLSGCVSLPDQPEDTVPRIAETLEFGRFAGSWECDIYTREPDGGWRQRAAGAIWRWFYILGGEAIQDIWEPEYISGSDDNVRGTNLRIYDPKKRAWQVVWMDSLSRTADFYEGRAEDGQIVLTRAAGDLAARVSFYNIAPDAFDWRHDISHAPGGSGWTGFRRMHCERTG